VDLFKRNGDKNNLACINSNFMKLTYKILSISDVPLTHNHIIYSIVFLSRNLAYFNKIRAIQLIMPNQ